MVDDLGLDGRVVPGGLLGGLFSNLLGTELPGRGTNWLKQSFVFHRGVRIGVEVTAVVEIIRLRSDKQLVNLRTTCTDPAKQPICTGEALVWVSDLETRCLETRCLETRCLEASDLETQ